MRFMAELCIPCCGTPRLLWGFTSPASYDPLPTPRLAFDGSSWDVSLQSQQQMKQEIFSWPRPPLLFSPFDFLLWKIQTATACVSWLHRLCRDKQLPRFITNTRADFSISSFAPHIWTLLWCAKNVFPKFRKQKLQINVDMCFSFRFFFLLSLSSLQWCSSWAHACVIKIPFIINISPKRSPFKIWNFADRKAGEIYFHAGPLSLRPLQTVSTSWVSQNKRFFHFHQTHVVVAKISLQRHNIKTYGSFWKSSLKEITTCWANLKCLQNCYDFFFLNYIQTRLNQWFLWKDCEVKSCVSQKLCWEAKSSVQRGGRCKAQ